MNITSKTTETQIPNGATHHDEQDYWKNKDGAWYIWLESCGKWRRIFRFQKFHDQLPIKPL